ncbi:hypothetical protein B0T14DRAFT_583758 [Immersiella caudata]|uniref:Heterokaryon incompatibility domain-containing protein n=1 Tax=Immersiella caudata TaxID=314043 RepID=A0AA39WZ72_9PEZI|nr:hypothetical protein B0T14DRAFT_583758 [Immersiella caudata]
MIEIRGARRMAEADNSATERDCLHRQDHNYKPVPTPVYRYSRLADNSIRVLQLLHDPDKHAPVRCRLSHLPLLEPRHGGTSYLFEALSYAWGPDVKDKSVLIQTDSGSTSLGVTTSLHEALLHLRDPFIDRFIWADAICINQDDWDERERQVRMMDRVYASASRVLVWLGSEEEHQGLFGKANALESLLRVARPGSQPLASDSRALSSLLERPWFTRMWVLQEVAVARQILVMHGPLVIEGQAFCMGLKTLLPLVEDERLQWLARSTAQLMQGAAFRPRFALQHPHAESPQEDVTGTRTKTLGELIDMFHDRKATKPHDKIYALLGMCADDVVENLLPNYALSWSEVFRRLIIHLLGDNATAVKTWDAEELVGVAAIEVSGHLVGVVTSVGEPRAPPDGTRLIKVQSRCLATVKSPRFSNEKGDTTGSWGFRSSSDFIKKGDFICELQQKSGTMVVRYHSADYFSIVCIMGPRIPDDIQSSTQTPSQVHTSQEDRQHRDNSLACIWDWGARASYATEIHPSSLGARLGNDPAMVLGRSHHEDENLWRASMMVLTSDHMNIAVANCLRVARRSTGLQHWQELERKLRGYLDWAEPSLGVHHRLTNDVVQALSDVYTACGDTKAADRLALASYVYSRQAHVESQIQDVDDCYFNHSHDFKDTLDVLKILDSPWSNVAQLFEERHLLRGRELIITQRMIPGVLCGYCFECDPIKDDEACARSDTKRFWRSMNTTSDASLGLVDFLSETDPDDSKIFPAVVLGMNETKLTEDAALRFARSPEWVMLAWERDKITPTSDILAAMMCHHHESSPGLQLLAISAAVAFILTHGDREYAASGSLMAEADRIAKELQRLRQSDGVKLAPSKNLIETGVDDDFMMSVAVHPHGAWILEVFIEAAGAERLPAVTEEVTLAAISFSANADELIGSLHKSCSLSNTKLLVTDEVMVAALRASNRRLVKLLLDGPPLLVDEERTMEEVSNSQSDLGLHSLPLPRALAAGEVPVTERVLRTAVETGSTDFLRNVLRVQDDERLLVTDGVALAVASSQDGDIMMRFFQWNQYASDQVSEEVVEAALANGWVPFLRTEEIEVSGCDNEDAVMPVSRRLKKLLRGMRLNDDYFTSLSDRLKKFPWDTRWRRAIGDLLTVLDIKGVNALPATEWAVKVAIQLAFQSVGEGFQMLRFLMDEYGADLPITEEVVFAAADMDETSLIDRHEDGYCGREKVFKLLVSHMGSRFPVSNRVLVAAVGHGCQPALKLLLKAKGNELEVTEDVLRTAMAGRAGNSYALWAWKLLLESDATFEVTDNILVMALENFLDLFAQDQDLDIDEDVKRKLCTRWKSLFRDLVRQHQRQRRSPTLPEELTVMATRSKGAFKFLDGIKGASPASQSKELLLEAHPDVLVKILDRDREISQRTVVRAIDACPAEMYQQRGEDAILPSLHFLLEEYGEWWLEENPAIRGAILRMAWRASPSQLTEMMELMPDLVEYVRDSDFPDGRKMRLVRWMMERMEGESGDSGRSSGSGDGYVSSAGRRQGNGPGSKDKKSKLGRFWKSFSQSLA